MTFNNNSSSTQHYDNIYDKFLINKHAYVVPIGPSHNSVSCLDEQSINILQSIADEYMFKLQSFSDNPSKLQQQILRTIQQAFVSHPYFIHHFYELQIHHVVSPFLLSCLVFILDAIKRYNDDEALLNIFKDVNSLQSNCKINFNLYDVLIKTPSDSIDTTLTDQVSQKRSRVSRQLFPCYQFDCNKYFKPCYYVGIVKLNSDIDLCFNNQQRFVDNEGQLCNNNNTNAKCQYGIFYVYVQNILHLIYILNESGYLLQPIKNLDELLACSNKQIFGLRSFSSHTDMHIYCPLYIKQLQLTLLAYNQPDLYDHVSQSLCVDDQDKKNNNFVFIEDQILLLNSLHNASDNFCF